MPKATKVEELTVAVPSSPTMANASVVITPAPLRPTMEMNSPMPAEMPYFRLAGTELTSVSRNLNRERTIKITPSIRMAVKATRQGSVMPISVSMGQTV